MRFENTRDFALQLDEADPLKGFRKKFHIPLQANGSGSLYFTGNSLGLQPVTTRAYIEQELSDWQKLGVEGHFHAKNPWMPYHEFVTDSLARLVGAKPSEVVAMGSLTANLHFLMVSFYRPEGKRRKILVEQNPFPSDMYAVKSQIEFHGGDPETDLLTISPRGGESHIRTEDILDNIEKYSAELALIMIGGVNYYTGQAFDMRSITEAGHKHGIIVGFDLAHAAGNIELCLHDWNVDFAAWCSYKYLNSGPGGIAGIFVHERHATEKLPRFAGWWGHDKSTRFLMGPDFSPIPGAEGWQHSNPPIFQLAALRASLEIFDEAGTDRRIEKSRLLTGFLEFCIKDAGKDKISIITPSDNNMRGCQLSIRVANGNKRLFDKITEKGVIADWREPDVIRVAPVPLYNTFEDVFLFAGILKELS